MSDRADFSTSTQVEANDASLAAFSTVTLPSTEVTASEKQLAQEASSAAHAAANPLKFGPDDGFHRELRRRVEQYFASTGRKPRDCPRMYVKSAVILGWFASSYLLLILGVSTWWLAIPVAVSLGLSMAAIGFNIQHDAGHRAYSEHAWVNNLMAFTLDLMGGSSYIWARKHNSIHHSFSNITGQDTDIELGIFGRLSPHQKRLGFHRLQHIYLWPLYGLLSVKWQLVDDFANVATGHIGDHRFARPTGRHLLAFIAGKAAFFSMVFVIPMLLHPIWLVLLFYLGISFVQGLVLSVVFQLAHAVEEAEFPMPQANTNRMETTWAAHQVQTTVDFARGNRFLSWLVGGLNFQIEHHLFPQICHIHYAALAPLVEETCREQGLRYSVHRTFWSGIASHFRWLRRMGAAEMA